MSVALITAACGTAASPEWADDAAATRIAQSEIIEAETAVAAGEQTPAEETPAEEAPTDAVTAPADAQPAATETPTETPEPATETPVPATEVPTEVPTEIPTEVPTEIPTEVPTEAPTEAEPTDAQPAADDGAAAGGADPVAVALAQGDPVAGQTVFQTPYVMADGAQWMCMSCHSVDASGIRLIGPGLWNIAVNGATRVEGQSAPEYIRNAILHPLDFLAPVGEGEPEWAINMPMGYEDVLTEQDLNDVIAYVLTLTD
ncbi:MAG: c-type cytochrome [Chloroflexi bacterium]|nr:c-type cytochrome [Chloroflexota bacterium]